MTMMTIETRTPTTKRHETRDTIERHEEKTDTRRGDP